MPVPFVGTGEAERLFRHRVIALLRNEGLLSEERIELLLSWHNSGFSVHNTVRVAAGDTAGIERLGRYLLRSPVAVERPRAAGLAFFSFPLRMEGQGNPNERQANHSPQGLGTSSRRAAVLSGSPPLDP